MQPPYHHNYQNRSGYQPYSSTSGQSTSKSSKQFKYMISVSRKHIVFFLFLIISIFGMFFILGLFTGYKVGRNTTPTITADINLPSLATNTEYAYDNYNNFDTTVLNSEEELQTQDNLEFVSKSVTTDVVASEGDVLQISGRDGIAPVERPTLKKPVSKTQVAKSVSITKPVTTSPYIRVPVPGVQYYYIQVIATEDIDRARNIYQRLKVRSFPVHVKKSAKNDKMLYAIRVGLYKTRGLANKHLRRIRNGGGYKSAFMKPYKVDKAVTTSNERSDVVTQQ